MRTNSMENTRSKNRKNKNHFKQKTAKVTADDVDDAEAQVVSHVDRVKTGHLATTPVAPAGNIVDMQGSLDRSWSC